MKTIYNIGLATLLMIALVFGAVVIKDVTVSDETSAKLNADSSLSGKTTAQEAGEKLDTIYAEEELKETIREFKSVINTIDEDEAKMKLVIVYIKSLE